LANRPKNPVNGFGLAATRLHPPAEAPEGQTETETKNGEGNRHENYLPVLTEQRDNISANCRVRRNTEGGPRVQSQTNDKGDKTVKAD
jgi:hypothetical protein